MEQVACMEGDAYKHMVPKLLSKHWYDKTSTYAAQLK